MKNPYDEILIALGDPKIYEEVKASGVETYIVKHKKLSKYKYDAEKLAMIDKGVKDGLSVADITKMLSSAPKKDTKNENGKSYLPLSEDEILLIKKYRDPAVVAIRKAVEATKKEWGTRSSK